MKFQGLQQNLEDPFKPKLANLTVKQIQLNLQNERGILNRNNHRPYKPPLQRKHLAPIFRKQLPQLFHNKKLEVGNNKMKNCNENKRMDHTLKQQRLNSGKTNGRNTFLLNSLIQILKTDESQSNSKKRVSLPKKVQLKTQPSEPYNQFLQSGNNTTKYKKGPKIIETEITRLGNHNNALKRKLYSQEKCRVPRQFSEAKPVQKQEQLQNVEILTFYNNCPIKIKRPQESADNQFIFYSQK